eukprot:symbB.v1.2.031650.t1/scaffold3695.1/size51858/1
MAGQPVRGVPAPPDVSIILPVYNAEAFLDEAFDSILQQSFLAKGGAVEVSCFDDGSSDGSARILERWQERLCTAFPDTLTFTLGVNRPRLAAAARGERRAEAWATADATVEGPTPDPTSPMETPCGLCGQLKEPEVLRFKKNSSHRYCETCWQLPKEEWQAKRREAYVRRTGQTSAGYGDTGPSVKGVPCGIGFACNSAISQSRGPFLCRFDADDVMHKERLEHQLEVLRNLPSEDQRRTLLGSGFVRMPEDATPRYTQWLNEMTDEQLTSQRFREVTLLHPTWMYHREIWERVGGYTEDTSVGEDIVFFHRHLETGGLLKRVKEPLLHYRCHPGQRSWRLPRRQVQSAKVAAFERQVLCHAPWSGGFGVVGAGRDARDMCKAEDGEDVGMDVGETPKKRG